jgi:hypothetical protein
MGITFNPLSGQFDNTGPKTSPGGSTTQVQYNDAGVFGASAAFTYIDNPASGSDSALLNISKNLNRTGIDVDSETFAAKYYLTSSDDLQATNDGSILQGASSNNFYFNGTVEAGGAVLSDQKLGSFNQLATNGIYSIQNASSDYYLSLTAGLNQVVGNQVVIDASSDSPNIDFIGSNNTCSGFVTNNGTGTPTIRFIGVKGTGVRPAGAAAQEAIGGDFTGSGATANYGVKAQGTTAAVYATGHYLFSAANTYDLGTVTNIARTIYTKRIDLSTATTSSDGVVIGGGRFYQDIATSGSGGTLINPRVQFRTANLLISAPTHTSSTANEFALQAQKTFTPVANTSGRLWGLNFSVAGSGGFNFTDATSSIVGVEGTVSNNSTGTVSAMSGAILFNSLGANSVTTRYAGLDVYGVDVSGAAGTGATVTEAAGIILRMGRSSGNTSLGNVTSLWGVQHRASTWSGTGHMTNQYGMAYTSGGTMNSITANSQVRKYIEVPAMPDPGAFTGTTVVGLDFLGTGGTNRDGIRFGGDTNLYRSAANTLRTDDSFVATGTVTGSNLSGTNTGDQTTIVGITGTMSQFNTAVTDGNILFNDEQGLGFRFENRTSDPGSPTVGQVWLRTDL